MTTADESIKAIREALERAAVEIDAAGHAGWGNTCGDGAAAITALLAEVDRLMADAERYEYMIDCDFKAGQKYVPSLNEADYKGTLRAKHDAAIAQEVNHG